MEFERVDTAGYREYMDKYKIGSLAAKLFFAAGFSDEQILDITGTPSLEDQSDDLTLRRIRERIQKAAQTGEKVFIAGDYDTDGLCGTAILVRLLNRLGIQNGYYIPNRTNEGYGLNMERTVQAITKGYTLFILVDNGVKAKEPLAYCKANGVDTIVLDHHTIDEEVACDYLFHPDIAKGKRSWLCGAGCAYETARMFGYEDDPEMVMLAMTATLGDMMELRGENRAIVRKGLAWMNSRPMPALKELIVRKDPPYNESDIAFQIVPKLNAVGRLAEGNETNRVVEYLTSDDPARIHALAGKLLEKNSERKDLTDRMIRSIRPEELTQDFVFVYHEDFKPGVVGLAAAHISSDLKKPVAVAGKKGNQAVVSARCPDGLNVMELLAPVSNLFDAFGGHPGAAGFSFSLDNLETVREFIGQLSCKAPSLTEPFVILQDSDLSGENLEELFSYRPFGMGAKLPKVGLAGPAVTSERELGRPEFKKWTFSNGLSALTFEASKITDETGTDQPLYIGQLDEEWFRGKRSYTLRLSKIKK